MANGLPGAMIGAATARMTTKASQAFGPSSAKPNSHYYASRSDPAAM